MLSVILILELYLRILSKRLIYGYWVSEPDQRQKVGHLCDVDVIFIRIFVVSTLNEVAFSTMSIDRDTFENANEDELEDLFVPDLVRGYFAVNEDRVFKTPEVASWISGDEGEAGTTLSRLKDRDLVEHKATYWAITDDAEQLD